MSSLLSRVDFRKKKDLEDDVRNRIEVGCLAKVFQEYYAIVKHLLG